MIERIKKNIPLIAILFVSFAIRAWGMSKLDLQSDAAINSFRAAGWFDYVAGAGQTSPIIWFGSIPWWANLSFHDHPPLVFFIQRLFFLFGDTTIGALLPYIFAGVATTFLVYLILKPSGSREALFGATLYALASYSVWGSRTAYLEGMGVLFVTASLVFLIWFLETGKKKQFYWWVLTLSMAIMSKYTLLFLLPAGIVLIAIYRRSLFRIRTIWFGALLFITILLPILVYNYMLYVTRGHFDAALSSIVGMRPDDFSSISERGGSGNLLSNGYSVLTTLATNMSAPLSILALISCALLLYQAFKRRPKIIDAVALINLAFMLLLFFFSGASVRFLSIIMPFICIVITRGAIVMASQYKDKKILQNAVVAVMLVAIFMETAYSINTNLALKPIGAPGIAYAAGRQESTGFQNLENYLKQEPLLEQGAFKRPKTLLGDSATYETAGKQVILMDVRSDWFSRMWYVRRFDVYHRLPIIYTTDLFASYQQSGFKEPIIAYVKALGAAKIWLVVATDKGIQTDTDPTYDKQLQDLIGWVESYGIRPVVIPTNDGIPAFNVYHFSFEQ